MNPGDLVKIEEVVDRFVDLKREKRIMLLVDLESVVDAQALHGVATVERCVGHLLLASALGTEAEDTFDIGGGSS